MAKTKKAAPAAAAFDKATYLKWYDMMLRIRRIEERAGLIYQTERKIRGFLHLCIGQEAVYAGMMTACRPDDAWITAYRQHGTAMAKGVSGRAVMAELFGRIDGNVKGKGGSMHFFDIENRYFGGHGIVGAQIGVGAGIAFADKYLGKDSVTLCLFGDGAARQGILHETFNMSMTWKLPVVFICENNLYAMGTSVERTSNVTEIHKLGLGYDMPSRRVDGMHPEAVHLAIAEANEHCRSGKGPVLLEIMTYRYRGHSMSDPAKYRTKEEEKEYKERDPLGIIETKMLAEGMITEEELKALQQSVKEYVEDAVRFADASPLPPASELYTDNYQQADYPYIMD